MASMILKIRFPKARVQKLNIELDKFAFERLAASFGFFNPEFIKSIHRAEKNYTAGRVTKIRSLRDLK